MADDATQQADALGAQIVAQGERVRTLKAAKDATPAAELQAAIDQLLALKAQFKALTGKEYGPPPKPKKEKKVKEPAAVEAAANTGDKKSKKQLNKERKKEKKAAIKSGEAAPPVQAAPSAEKTTKNPKQEPARITGPVCCTLPVPEADRDGVVVFSSASVLPRATYVVAKLLNLTSSVPFENHVKQSTLVPTMLFASGEVLSGDLAMARFLCRKRMNMGLYGSGNDEDPLLTSQIDGWLDFALEQVTMDALYRALSLLNTVLQQRTYLVGYGVTLADIAVWSRLSGLGSECLSAMQPFDHLMRWWNHLQAMDVFGQAATHLKSLKAIVPSSDKIKFKDQRKHAVAKAKQSGEAFVSQKGKSSGNCPPLHGAVEGQVVTRFPPEPSGYLHIGHVKACMLNHYYARHYQGKLIVRFDDTNPSKEKDEFEKSILQDLKRLDIVPDIVTYTSDSFPQIIELAKQMIREGHAYMDNTPQEQMREERMNGINSKCRDQSPEVNMQLFDKMLQNHADAAGYCLRGKIDMQAKNKTLRDPVFFRANPLPHHRTGTKYCAYPTYDLACPIVDSLEGVTHALRTTEYNDRDEQYQWVLKTLRLRPVHIHGFARMNFVHSVLSKRKLQWFVDNGHVNGWNDPRFPTVQGVLRRGVQVDALRDFILSQGASRRITDMEWDKFWTVNKRVIDPVAPRYFAIDKANAVPLRLTNVSDEVIGIPVPRHPKDASKGNKIMRFSSNLLLERDDAKLFTEGEEVTLMRHGNIIVKKVIKDANGTVTGVQAENHPTGDFKKTKLKVTWLADVPDLVPCTLVEFDHLINKPKLEENDDFKDHLTPVTRAEMKAIGDHELRNAQRGDVVQLERRGFFRVDEPYLSADKPLVLFMVPDGKAKAMSTLSTNLAHR